MPALIACLAAGCALAACRAQPAPQPTYLITVSGAGNRVAPLVKWPLTRLEVRSETGLGSARAEQTGGPPPGALVIQLYLGGLEEFNFDYGGTTIIVSVSSHGDGQVSERMRSVGAAETQIDSTSPYWMPVQIVGEPTPGAANPAAYFEVRASQDFIQGRHAVFSMRWIDFYR